MDKKERYKALLLEYLGNPENDFPVRTELGVAVLDYKQGRSIYRIFTPQELDEIERKAFESRKRQSSAKRARVYDSLYKKAIGGDIRAMKEFLDRTEGKVTDKIQAEHKISQTLVDKRQARRIAEEVLNS